MCFMAMRNSISVRFPEDMRGSLEAIAKTSGLTAADLVRLATIEYINRAKQTGSINIPIADPHPGSNGNGKKRKG